MRTFRIGHVAALVVAGTVAAAGNPRMRQDPPAQTVFRAATAGVAVDVSVRELSRVVNGLQVGDFELFDNGVLQTLKDVSYGKLPIDVTIALDVSYSVTGDLLGRLQEAVGRLMSDLGKQDRLKLILFNTRISRAFDFTTDIKAVEVAIREARPGGATPLFDAVSVALVSAVHPDRRQLVVFFSDGRDSLSTTSPAALKSLAQRTNATFSMVIPTTPAMPTGGLREDILLAQALQQRQLMSLTAVSFDTGGEVLTTNRTGTLTEYFMRVLDAFRETYVLYFTPTGVDRSGYHELQVKVKRKDVTVKARRGYFGG